MNDKKEPYFYIFAGINGAGKTSLYYNELETGKVFGYRINIDEIVSSFGDWKSKKDQNRAAKIAIKQKNTYIQNRYSFNLETTLSGKSTFNTISKAKKFGFKLCMYYVGLESVELAKQRVEQRMLKGGHFVSGQIIERRYPRSLNNLHKILPLVDEAYIYDNSNTPKLIATKKKNKLHVKTDTSWFKI